MQHPASTPSKAVLQSGRYGVCVSKAAEAAGPRRA